VNAKLIHHWSLPSNPGTKCVRAFTRIELAAVVVGMALLSVIALPLLGTTRADSERAACYNNLRQIGRAVRQWSGDHFEEPPWLTSMSDGGTRPDGGMKIGAAWAEYLSLSNELFTPRILACPSDAGVKVASEWGVGPNGLVNPGFRRQAISYLLGLHANSLYPLALVAADFNIRLSGPATGCELAAVNNAYALYSTPPLPPPPAESVRWTNGPHLSGGHLLVVDGSVMFVNSAGLTRTLSTLNSEDNGIHHVLRAH